MPKRDRHRTPLSLLYDSIPSWQDKYTILPLQAQPDLACYTSTISMILLLGLTEFAVIPGLYLQANMLDDDEIKKCEAKAR